MIDLEAIEERCEAMRFAEKRCNVVRSVTRIEALEQDIPALIAEIRRLREIIKREEICIACEGTGIIHLTESLTDWCIACRGSGKHPSTPQEGT